MSEQLKDNASSFFLTIFKETLPQYSGSYKI